MVKVENVGYISDEKGKNIGMISIRLHNTKEQHYNLIVSIIDNHLSKTSVRKNLCKSNRNVRSIEIIKEITYEGYNNSLGDFSIRLKKGKQEMGKGNIEDFITLNLMPGQNGLVIFDDILNQLKLKMRKDIKAVYKEIEKIQYN